MQAGQVVRMNSSTTTFPRWSEILKGVPSTSVNAKSGASARVVVVWTGVCGEGETASQIRATMNTPIAMKPMTSVGLRLRLAFLRANCSLPQKRANICGNRVV